MTVIRGRACGIATDPDNRQKDDFYTTPREAVIDLLSVERFSGQIWEPSCGEGAISDTLKAYGYDVVSTDLVDRGYGTGRVDFLMEFKLAAPNLITNPPFKYLDEYMSHAVSLRPMKMALLLRTNCLEGLARRKIYEKSPLSKVWVFSRRLKMKRNGTEGGDSSGMISFAWFIWEEGYNGSPVLGWL
jgi:hypothetical protein